jgi:hypothetical protein
MCFVNSASITRKQNILLFNYRLAHRWAAQFALAQNPKVVLDVRYLHFIWHDTVRAGSAIYFTIFRQISTSGDRPEDNPAGEQVFVRAEKSGLHVQPI